MATKYTKWTNIFHCKTPKFTQIWIFSLKIYHLATLDSNCGPEANATNSFEKELTRIAALHAEKNELTIVFHFRENR
jgi:hypothetical protein